MIKEGNMRWVGHAARTEAMMETVSTFQMSVILYQSTRRNIPEDSHLHLENLYSEVQNGFTHS
jgi:hypothetical protein